MCDDKDVQRLTFDSYLYKRVVAMNPWQQIKLTVLTLAAVLRGQALAPAGYKPVSSAVRSAEEAEAIFLAAEPRSSMKPAGVHAATPPVDPQAGTDTAKEAELVAP